MASLNHVCMWSEHGWTRVTAEEAGKLHPGGTVSALSGLFMCELCGQYVTLTVLNKICSALNANIGDVMDFIPEEEKR